MVRDWSIHGFGYPRIISSILGSMLYSQSSSLESSLDSHPPKVILV